MIIFRKLYNLDENRRKIHLNRCYAKKKTNRYRVPNTSYGVMHYIHERKLSIKCLNFI